MVHFGGSVGFNSLLIVIPRQGTHAKPTAHSYNHALIAGEGGFGVEPKLRKAALRCFFLFDFVQTIGVHVRKGFAPYGPLRGRLAFPIVKSYNKLLAFFP